MTIQKISNEPSFTSGKLFFVDSAGKKHRKFERFFSPVLEKEFEEIRKLIKNKKYNLYFSYKKEKNYVFEFNANYNYRNIKGSDLNRRAIPIIAEDSSLFVGAAKMAMNSFEETTIYKRPSLYRKFVNFFSKNK